MKNLVSIAMLLLFCTITANAQTEKGTFSLGLRNFSPGGFFQNTSSLSQTNFLGIGFGKTKSKTNDTDGDESKYSVVGLGLNAQYFVANNFSLGLLTNVLTQKETVEETINNDREEFTISILLAGPQIRYYFNIGAKTKLYLDAYAAVGNSKVKYTDEEEDDTTSLSSFGGGLNFAYFPSPNFSVDLGLGYDFFKTKNEDSFLGTDVTFENTSGGVVFDIGFSAFF